MARHKPLDECMFCGGNPCVCGKPAAAPAKPKVAKPKVEKPKTESLPVPPKVSTPRAPKPPPPSALDAMRAVAKAAPPPPPIEATTTKGEDEVDPEFASSIRALAPILHPDERRTYSNILKSEPTVAERAVTWKRKHKEGMK